MSEEGVIKETKENDPKKEMAERVSRLAFVLLKLQDPTTVQEITGASSSEKKTDGLLVQTTGFNRRTQVHATWSTEVLGRKFNVSLQKDFYSEGYRPESPGETLKLFGNGIFNEVRIADVTEKPGQGVVLRNDPRDPIFEFYGSGEPETGFSSQQLLQKVGDLISPLERSVATSAQEK